jgi:hypothetical protein
MLAKVRGEKLMKYKVEIIEKLSMSVEVEASSAEEAFKRVSEKYWNEQIVVESSDGPDVEFQIFPLRENGTDILSSETAS